LGRVFQDATLARVASLARRDDSRTTSSFPAFFRWNTGYPAIFALQL